MLTRIQSYVTVLSQILTVLITELQRKDIEEKAFLQQAKEVETLLQQLHNNALASVDQKTLEYFSKNILTMEQSNKTTFTTVKRVNKQLKKAVDAYNVGR